MADVEFENVTKVFPGDTVALEDFTLHVVDGEFLVVVGPSGCGKSTVLRILAGLETVSDGELRIGGERVNGRTPQERNIAMVFQNYALYPHKTVRQNLDFPLRMMGLEEAEREKRIGKTAEILGIRPCLERKPRRDARPSRSDDAGRPRRGTGGRQAAAGRFPAADLRCAREHFRSRVHRQSADEPLPRAPRGWRGRLHPSRVRNGSG